MKLPDEHYCNQGFSMPSVNFLKALELHRKNRFGDALRFYESSPEVQVPRDFEAAYYPALAYAQSGRSELSYDFYRRALEIDPKHKMAANAHIMLGRIEATRERYDEALFHLTTALKLSPNSGDGPALIGNVYAQMRKFQVALEWYNCAVVRNPQDFRALSNRANTLRELGRIDEAITACQKAIKLKPDYAPVYNNRGICYIIKRKFSDAVHDLYRAVELNPDYAEAHLNLAKALSELKNAKDAVVGYKAAIRLNPHMILAYVGLAEIEIKEGRTAEAEVILSRALEIDPDNVEAMLVKAEMLAEQNRHEFAINIYDKLIAEGRELSKAYSARSVLLQQLGRFEEAAANIQTMIRANPDDISAHQKLALLAIDGKCEEGESVDKIISYAGKIQDSDAISIGLNFTLGKIFDKKKQYDLSFKHYAKANKLRRAELNYSPEVTEKKVSNLISAYSQEIIEQSSGSGCDSTVPIFIVGMPRSGTTLLETILSRHPAIFAAGELNDFNHLALDASDRRNIKFEELGSRLTVTEMTELGQKYVAQLRRRSPDSPHITDKMPANFFNVGLIHMAVPQSKIIHIRRNPIDTCLSNFEQNFSGALDYSYDLRELGHYYKSYHRLMAHWRTVLPPNTFYEIDYETLVSEQRETVQRILEYCKLNWHEECLEFSTAERRIKTASISQVRRGLYSSSVEKWRRYERHIKPLIDELGHLVKAE